MLTMLILSILLVALGTGAAVWSIHDEKGLPWSQSLPESISAMVYLLPERGGWRWLWSLWLVLVDVLTFAPVIEILDRRGFGILGFLPMVMLVFVAAWPLFDTEHRFWHYALAIAAAVVSQIDVWLICPWWLLTWLLILAAWIWTTKDAGRAAFDGKGVLFFETVCYAAIIGAVLTCKAALA